MPFTRWPDLARSSATKVIGDGIASAPGGADAVGAVVNLPARDEAGGGGSRRRRRSDGGPGVGGQ